MAKDFQFHTLTEGLGLEEERLERGNPSLEDRIRESESPFSQKREKPPLKPRFSVHKDSSLGYEKRVRESVLFKPAFFSFSSCFVDVCITLGFTLYSICTILLILHLDGMSLVGIGSLSLSWSYVQSLFLLGGCLWLASHFIYTLLCRCFAGATLGEWIYQVQLGTSHQFRSPFYIFRVLWRYALMMLTGWFLLPLFSWALREDLLGYLSGLSLWQREKRQLV